MVDRKKKAVVLVSGGIDSSTCLAIAGHVGHGHFAIFVQRGGDDADGGFNFVIAGFDFPQMRQRDDQADGAMAAHAEAADVIEENHAGGAGFVRRLDQQRADHHIRAARFVDHRGAETVVLRAECLQLIGDASGAKGRPAGNDHPSRLAAGMRINDGDASHGLWEGGVASNIK